MALYDAKIERFSKRQSSLKEISRETQRNADGFSPRCRHQSA